MPETTTQTAQSLFPAGTETADSPLASSPLGNFAGGSDMSQNEKDAILRQIHPIFLTAHSEEKAPVQQGNFDKFLGFMRLCLEGLLKLVDIIVDAAIQIARLAVWIVAIAGVLIVVTLMTNTTDKFIDILNSSIFPIVGLETKIQKVGPTTPVFPLGTQTEGTQKSDLESSVFSEEWYSGPDPEADSSWNITGTAEEARQELLRARRARLAEPSTAE